MSSSARRPIPALLTVVITGVSIAGCSGGGNPAADPRRVSEAFAAAYNAKDAGTIASLYADDAELMAPDAYPIKGRAAIEALFREKFEQNCSMELRSRSFSLDAGQAFDTGDIAITMSDADGGPRRIAGRYLAVMKRVGSEWKIAYHMQTVEPQ